LEAGSASTMTRPSWRTTRLGAGTGRPAASRKASAPAGTPVMTTSPPVHVKVTSARSTYMRRRLKKAGATAFGTSIMTSSPSIQTRNVARRRPFGVQ